jgi:hypothetical protein
MSTVVPVDGNNERIDQANKDNGSSTVVPVDDNNERIDQANKGDGSSMVVPEGVNQTNKGNGYEVVPEINDDSSFYPKQLFGGKKKDGTKPTNGLTKDEMKMLDSLADKHGYDDVIKSLNNIIVKPSTAKPSLSKRAAASFGSFGSLFTRKKNQVAPANKANATLSYGGSRTRRKHRGKHAKK